MKDDNSRPLIIIATILLVIGLLLLLIGFFSILIYVSENYGLPLKGILLFFSGVVNIINALIMFAFAQVVADVRNIRTSLNDKAKTKEHYSDLPNL